jgi:hypothetical protein
MLSTRFARLASFVALASVALATACTTNPTAQEVVDRSTPPICEKAKQCLSTFAVAYPGGIDDCVAKTKDAASKKYGSDLEKSSVCTDDEVSKCIEDLKAAACPPGETMPEIPCKC